MSKELSDVLEQLRRWNNSGSRIRIITSEGVVWVTRSVNVGKESVLLDKPGGELGSETLKLSDAEVFELRDEDVIVSWPSGKTIRFQKEK